MIKKYKEVSRVDFALGHEGNPTESEIKLGCLMRIADSLEQIEKPYLQLLGDVKYLSDQNKDKNYRIKKLIRRIAGLKGHIKRLNKGKNGKDK